MEEEDALAAADLADPNPDVAELFAHYDKFYFQGALSAAGFAVQWSSLPQTSSFGSCTFLKPRNTITLSEPVLKYRSCTDRKKALLHEMIHAILYVKHHRKDCNQHGPDFRAWMDAINSCSLKDPQRPVGGYNITTRHDCSQEQPRSFKGLIWKCESCGDTLARATNQGPPSDACCIENVHDDATCGNVLCHWHNHKNECGGTYENMGLQTVTPVQKKVPKGTKLLLTCTSEMSKSQGAIQESGSAEVKENTKVTKPNAEEKHPSLGSSSSIKAGKRRRSEVIRKASVLPVEPPKRMKLKQALVATEKHELFSQAGCNNAKLLGSSTAKKAGKQHKTKDVQKLSVLPAAPLGTLNLKQGLVTTERHKLFSLEGCNGEKSLGSSSSQMAGIRRRSEVVRKASVLPVESPKRMTPKQTLVATEKHKFFSPAGSSDSKSPGSRTSKKAGKQGKIEDVQKPSVLPAAPQGKPKLMQELFPTEKGKLFSLAHYNDDAKSLGSNTSKKVGEQHKPESSQKTCSQPAHPQRRLEKGLVASEKNELLPVMGCSNEKLLDRSSSKKTCKQYEPENVQKTTVLPAVPGSKLKESSSVAMEKQKRRCKRKPAREKEYAVMSLWLNYYESDTSSGLTEPLVNKRTERRKRERERERILTYSRSKKKINSVPLDDSRINASATSHNTDTEPCKDESAQQSRPPSSCSAIASVATLDQVVPQDQSQPSAPCLDIVPLKPANPPGSLPPDQSAGLDIIEISDDD